MVAVLPAGRARRRVCVVKAPEAVWGPAVVDIVVAGQKLVEAQLASERAARSRGDLRPGSTRARVTTANARWANAAEARDLCAERYRDAVAREAARLGLVSP